MHSTVSRLLTVGFLAFITLGEISSAQNHQRRHQRQGSRPVRRRHPGRHRRDLQSRHGHNPRGQDGSPPAFIASWPFLAYRYAVEVTASGFEKYIRQPIDVDVAVNREIDVTVTPGSTNQVVTVESQAPPR